MIFTTNKPTLTVREGIKKGRRFTLRQDEIAIGSGRRCQVFVKAPEVAERHALLKARNDDTWELQNLSEFGTRINQIPVSRKILRPGDLIQIGYDTVLEFQHPAAAAEPQHPDGISAPAPAAAGSKHWFSPKIIAAVGVWYVLMAALFVALNNIDLSDTAVNSLTAAELDQVLEQTRAWLDQDAPRLAATAVSGCRTLDSHSEPAYQFYTLLCQQGRAIDAGVDFDVSSALRKDAIIGQLDGYFHNAWHKEMQGQWRAALAYYRAAIATVPDVRSPATRLANARMLALNELIEIQQ